MVGAELFVLLGLDCSSSIDGTCVVQEGMSSAWHGWHGLVTCVLESLCLPCPMLSPRYMGWDRCAGSMCLDRFLYNYLVICIDLILRFL